MITCPKVGCWWGSTPCSPLSSSLLLLQLNDLSSQVCTWPGLSVEKAMATHSSTLAWEIPWTEEPGRLQSMGSLRVGHDWATSLSLFTFMHWRRKWNPLQCSCLENPRDGGAWWVAIYGVAQSQTRMTCLNSSSNRPLRSTVLTKQYFNFMLLNLSS